MSFEEFVQGSSPRLFRTALLLTEHDRAAAEDLLQVALERAYRHWARICRSEEPKRYVESSVAAEHPPADLVARVRRRHRWHLARLGAMGVTAVIAAAVAVPPARSALLKSVTTPPATCLTEYYIGVVVAGPRCVTIDVRTSAGQSAYRATLQFGTCGP